MSKYKVLQIPVIRQQNTASVLFIGDGNKFQGFFNLLVSRVPPHEAMDVILHVTHELPLRRRNDNQESLEVDLIIILIDCCNKTTYLNAYAAVEKFIPTNFFLGRVMFVGYNIQEDNISVDPEQINELAESVGSIVLWDELSDSNEFLALQILSKLKFLTCSEPFQPPIMMHRISQSLNNV